MRSQDDVPADDDWLSDDEREALGGLAGPKRQAEFRLGRYTAKGAVAAWLGEDPAAVEIAGAADGAPEAWSGGAPAPVSLSLSHRHGRALAVVAGKGAAVGCDLERLDPRRDAFVRRCLAPAERELAEGGDEERRVLVVNLAWTAKEAALKLLRAPRGLDLRQAVAHFAVEEGDGRWHALTVEWPDRPGASGWWRAEPGWVMATVADPAPDPPRPL